MFSSSHFIASVGLSPQFVGQVERTSIMQKPLPSISYLKAFLMAFLVLMMLALLFTAQRSMY